jgi:aminopeptidase-like protein
MLAAHLCHPAMVNDDLTGVVVGLEVMKRLAQKAKEGGLFYSYRLLILPETIGSVAYLSHNERLIPQMVGGLFLEMLGNDSAHALQGSYMRGEMDRCLGSGFKGLDPDGYQGAYRTIIDNDERQFNAPGVRVPMLSLSRVESPKSSGCPPYQEYHSSLDTPAIVSRERLVNSCQVVLGLIEAWERNLYVVNLFKGEIFCSGYGIWVDYRVNPDGHRRLFEIMERCDGTLKVGDIADELGISFQAVWEVVAMLEEKGLVRLSRAPINQ